MKCIQCEAEVSEQANFCPNCGTAKQAKSTEKQFCSIAFRQVDEKWSLFGKEIWRFEAVASNGAVVGVSDKITITGFELYGPNEKNRKHKSAFNALVEQLLADGWQQESEGKAWYEINFCKPVKYYSN